MTDNIEYISSEENDYYTNDDIYNFNSWGADLSFRELINRYEENELIKPELHRKYVWDKVEASRFIDSILIGLPIPSIFLAHQEDETLLIIDGYQRIMTVYDFVRGIFSKDNKIFKLSKSEKINKRWKGKAFQELSEVEQRRIRNTTIHAILFVQNEPKNNNTGMYQVFERINTTGKSLFPQEIRNCVYQGNFNDFLFTQNEYLSWRKLFGTETPDNRMRDMEFILRYLYMKNLDFLEIDKKTISLKKELNIFMGRKKNNEKKNLDAFGKQFTNSCDKAYEMFDSVAFHNVSKANPDKLTNKFNPTIFDSIMIAISNQKKIKIDVDWEKRRRKLLNDSVYQDAIRVRTTNVDRIQTRFELAEKYLFKDE